MADTRDTIHIDLPVHAAGPNVAGVIASAAGIMITCAPAG